GSLDSGDGAESEFRAGARRIRNRSERGVGLFATMEFYDSENDRQEFERRSRISRLEKYTAGRAGRECQSVAGYGSGARRGAAREGAESVSRTDSGIILTWRRDTHRTATLAAVPALYDRRVVPR